MTARELARVPCSPGCLAPECVAAVRASRAAEVERLVCDVHEAIERCAHFVDPKPYIIALDRLAAMARGEP